MSVHDEKIEALIKEVEKRKAALGSKPRNILRTNGILKFNDREHINLNTVSDIETIVKSYAYIIEQFEDFKTAANELEVDIPFTKDGFSDEDWKEDLKDRLASIKWNKKKVELDALTKKLESLVSEEAKTKNELASIEKLLAD